MTPAEANSKPNQTSKMDFFPRIINGLCLLTTLAKSSFLDICMVSECTSGLRYINLLFTQIKETIVIHEERK